MRRFPLLVVPSVLLAVAASGCTGNEPEFSLCSQYPARCTEGDTDTDTDTDTPC